MSKKTTENEQKKNKVVTPYIVKPLIYFLIGLVIVLPIALGLLHAAVSVVHRAQPHFAKTMYEVELNDSAFTPSTAMSGSATLPLLATGDKVGTLTCADKGMNTEVYYGSNRVSYRSGAGISAKSGLPGQGEEIDVKGYAGGGMKATENLEEGDVITFTTSWGIYRYEVISADVSSQQLKPERGEILLLSCAKSKNAFSNFADERLYVAARYLSGPSAEEVAQ